MESLGLVESSGQSQIDLVQRWSYLMIGKMDLMEVEFWCLSLKLKMVLIILVRAVSSLICLEVDMTLQK